ncbi:hypothetical protein N7470_007637 [Penicillium chermesinum]|nr:hypothetical protein N7470_007637 [Penicillium chermesinum]
MAYEYSGTSTCAGEAKQAQLITDPGPFFPIATYQDPVHSLQEDPPLETCELICSTAHISSLDAQLYSVADAGPVSRATAANTGSQLRCYCAAAVARRNWEAKAHMHRSPRNGGRM